MPRKIFLECNKLHGFLQMNHFVDQQAIPCVRSKIFDRNTDLSEKNDELYTIKVVKDIKTSCIDCSVAECDNCLELENLYQDYGLPLKIKIKNSEFEKWSSDQLLCDPDSLFYYYKFFEADLFGKLIVGNKYYCIEAIDKENLNVIENKIFWKKDDIFSMSMKHFSKSQTDDILSYAQIIERKMRVYLEFDYSIIMDFAFTTAPYFLNNEFSNTNLLFYGLRSAFNKVDLEYSV